MKDKQKNTAAIGRAGTKGCRIKSAEQDSAVSVAPNKQKLMLVHSSEAVKRVRLAEDADTELRELIGSLQERQVKSAHEDDLPPAA